MAKRATPAKSAKRAKPAAKRSRERAPARAKRSRERAPARAKRSRERAPTRAKPKPSRKPSRTAKASSSRKAARKAAKPRPADPRALTPAQAARLLQVPAKTIRDHLAAGAPADSDGRINLVAYAAWLCRQRAGEKAPAEANS